jgi:hypothetical protein
MFQDNFEKIMASILRCKKVSFDLKNIVLTFLEGNSSGSVASWTHFDHYIRCYTVNFVLLPLGSIYICNISSCYVRARTF